MRRTDDLAEALFHMVFLTMAALTFVVVGSKALDQSLAFPDLAAALFIGQGLAWAWFAMFPSRRK